MKGELDVELLRAETPGCMVSRFFNHSGASLPSTSTLSAITNHLERESLYGGMESAELVMPQVEKIRSDAEALLGAGANEVAFTSSASAARAGATVEVIPCHDEDGSPMPEPLRTCWMSVCGWCL